VSWPHLGTFILPRFRPIARNRNHYSVMALPIKRSRGAQERPCSLVVRAGRIYGNVKLPKLNVRPSPVKVTFSRLPEISWRFCPGGHVSVDAGRETVRLPVV
jgi:hypothetical protein